MLGRDPTVSTDEFEPWSCRGRLATTPFCIPENDKTMLSMTMPWNSYESTFTSSSWRRIGTDPWACAGSIVELSGRAIATATPAPRSARIHARRVRRRIGIRAPARLGRPDVIINLVHLVHFHVRLPIESATTWGATGHQIGQGHCEHCQQ